MQPALLGIFIWAGQSILWHKNCASKPVKMVDQFWQNSEYSPSTALTWTICQTPKSKLEDLWKKSDKYCDVFKISSKLTYVVGGLGGWLYFFRRNRIKNFKKRLFLCSNLEYASHYLCQQCHETSTWFCIIDNSNMLNHGHNQVNKPTEQACIRCCPTLLLFHGFWLAIIKAHGYV